MKRLSAFVVLLLAAVCYGQDVPAAVDSSRFLQARLQEVGGAFGEHDYRKAVTILEDLRTWPQVRQDRGVRQGVLYNLACGYSRLGEREKALGFLREAVDAGFADFDLLDKDSDLDSLRGTKDFAPVRAEVARRHSFWENSFMATPYRDTLSASERAAGLSRLWAEIKFNFIYFDRVPGLNWDSLYTAYLPRALEPQSTLEYYKLLSQMAAQLHDGHTRVNEPPPLYDSILYQPALRTRLVDEQVIVVQVSDPALSKMGIRPGAKILQVDSQPVRDYATEHVAPYVSASTPQGAAVQVYDYELLLGPKNSTVDLELQDGNGKPFVRTLKRDHSLMAMLPSGVEYRRLPGNMAYVAIRSFGLADIVARFDSLWNSLAQAEALILDLRENGGGNSGPAFDILGYLTADSFDIIRWDALDYRPLNRARGGGVEKYEEPQVRWAANGTKHFDRPAAVLIGPRTGSAAEDACATFRAMKRGVLVGEATNGSTGQPLIFSLPGGGNATVCTAHCTYPDGSEFVGIGVLPDIEARATISDIRNGRDPVLDAAVKQLKRPVTETRGSR
jgi:carboxyl-terminal processing protease